MDDDDEKFKQRQGNGLAKAKTKKFGGAKRGLDSRQWAMMLGGCFLISWGLAVTFLLLRLGIMYTFDTITLTRQEYCMDGAAHWAKLVAAKEVMQAIEVWNLINASITGLVYRAPLDYTNLGNVLSPAFETMPLLHSVEIGFSDRMSHVALTSQQSQNPAVRGAFSIMQSNSEDCFLMGVDGCVSHKTIPGLDPRPDWYQFGIGLKTKHPLGGVYYWAAKPELVVEAMPDGGDILSPAVRLIFKVPFPTFRSTIIRGGKEVDGGSTIVVGRITVKLHLLGGSALLDKALGDDGNVYLADATGAVLASRTAGDLLGVQNGRIRFKSIWELPNLGSAKVRGAFTGSSVREIEDDSDGTFVAIEPLDNPLARFAVVVVAPSASPFQNPALIGTSAFASIVAPAPYAITGALSIVFFCAQCINTMYKTDGNTGLDLVAAKGRVSISATMGRHTVSNLPIAEMMKAEQSPVRQKWDKMKGLVKLKLGRK